MADGEPASESERGLRVEQKHGKSRVRVCRVWRNGQRGAHSLAEWNVAITLLSHSLPSYFSGDNSAVVATDTIKNTVYSAIIKIVEKPWERVFVDGQPHHHGFKLGNEKHSAEIIVKKRGELLVTSSIEGLALLKTTQSGFVGFVRDKYTILPDTTERMLATEVSASWRYTFGDVKTVPTKPFCFTQRFLDVKKTLTDTFFGPPKAGVYSPSVQNTVYLMGKAVLSCFPEIAAIQLRMPNLHFLPVNLQTKDSSAICKFDNDVYLPTDEPHGTIEATVSHTLSKL